MALNNGQKAKIHVAKQQLGLSDKEYRTELAAVGRKSAADKQFTLKQYRELIDRFKALGFVPKTKKRRRPRPAKDKEALVRKIWAIRDDLGLTDSYIDATCQRMFKDENGVPISSYQFLNPKQLHGLVAALSYHQTRKKGRSYHDRKRSKTRRKN